MTNERFDIPDEAPLDEVKFARSMEAVRVGFNIPELLQIIHMTHYSMSGPNREQDIAMGRANPPGSEHYKGYCAFCGNEITMPSVKGGYSFETARKIAEQHSLMTTDRDTQVPCFVFDMYDKMWKAVIAARMDLTAANRRGGRMIDIEGEEKPDG